MSLKLDSLDLGLRQRVLKQMRDEDEARAVKKGVSVPAPQKVADEKTGRVTFKDKPAKRVRQGEKLPNKLERDWALVLRAKAPHKKIYEQAVRFRIGNGAWYKPDQFCSNWKIADGECGPVAWECKGPKEMKNVDRGVLALKTAAAQFPDVLFILVWRDKSGWHEQKILP